MSDAQALGSAPNFHRPVETSAAGVRVADQILDRLRRRGIDRIFGIPGGTISPIFDALNDTDIEVVLAQHETMAVYMAAGYALATGRPGVVAVTSGPGALNAVTGCASAYLDGIPLLLLVGEPPLGRAGRSPLQEGSVHGLDLLNMFRSITRHREMLTHPHRAAPMVDHALAVAEGPLPGPVLLQLPVDVAQNRCEPPRAIEVPVPPPQPAPPSACAEISQRLDAARRPLILLGRGARARGVSDRVLELAEFLRCPVATDIEAKGVFPESHPLSLGVFGVGQHGCTAEYLAGGVDLLLTLGCRLDDTTTGDYSPLLRSAKTWIQLDADPSRLGRSYPVDHPVLCDLSLTLEEILERIPIPRPFRLIGRDRCLRRLKMTSVGESTSFSEDAGRWDPRRVAPALQAAFPDALFTADIGNNLLFASETLRIDSSDGFYVALGLGGMGGGIGTAVGMQMGVGSSRRVISICGDGALLLAGTEIATCARYGLPVVFAVFNDGALGMVEQGMELLYGRRAPWRSPAVDLVQFARSLGLSAYSVSPSDGLADFNLGRETGPLLLEFPIRRDCAPSNPRVDACSMPPRATG